MMSLKLINFINLKINKLINLDWMNDKIGYEETAEEVDSVI